MIRLASMNLVLLVLVGCGSSSVGGAELTRLFSGARVTGDHVVDGYTFERVYDRTTFTQTGPRPGTGTWRVSGDQMCIRWADRPDKADELCRHMRTDDLGAYWKELRTTKRKRNGDTKRIVKTVVRYDSIVDADTGEDRRRIKTYLEAHLGQIVAGAVALLGSLVVGSRVAWSMYWGSPLYPYSRVSLARRDGPLDLGGETFEWSEIASDPLLLAGCLTAACRAQDDVVLTWTLDALEEHGARHLAAVAIAAHLEACSRPSDVLRWLGPRFDASGLLEQLDDDDRIIGMGLIFRDLAKDVHTSDEAAFDHFKAAGELFLGGVRERLAAPAPLYDGSVNKEVVSGGHPLFATVGAAYEELMYLKYTPPVRAKRNSSSYSGGG